MTLATRCPACQTVFRVVKDQLLVSEGWVRCGRCSDVFNAQKSLFDLEREGVPPTVMAAPQPPSPTALRVLEELSRQGQGDPVRAAMAPPGPLPQGWDKVAVPPPPLPGRFGLGRNRDLPERFDLSDLMSAETVAAAALHRDDAPEESASAAAENVTVTVAAVAAPALDATPQAAPDEAPALVADDPPPRFVLAADRAAFWRRSAVRAMLVASTVLLALTLAAQALLGWRHLLAAQHPVLKPVLGTLCQALGCRIEPLRRIDGLSVDASGLTRLEGTALYKLSVVLRNRGELAVLAPALELSLTDFQGRTQVRKVLTLADFGMAASLLEAGQELPLQATLSAGDRRITGYTVEVFYP